MSKIQMHNRFSSQTFTHRVISSPANFVGQIISLGDGVNAAGLQLNKSAERKETNIPPLYLGYTYRIAYIEDKINPTHLQSECMVLNYSSFTANTVVALAGAGIKFGLVIRLGDFLSDNFHKQVYVRLTTKGLKIDTLFLVLDGTCDEMRMLYTDMSTLTDTVVMYGTIDQYIKMDAKARYSARMVFTKSNPVRLDLVLARSVQARNITAVVYMPDLDFINNGVVTGTKPVRGMFLPIDLYEAFCLEGNFMTYDVELTEHGRLYFPTRYNRTVNFYTNLADIIITNSKLDIGLMLNIDLIAKYKTEYKKMTTGGSNYAKNK